MLKSVCLVMIVKNEAAVIERCLRSVKPLISHWIIIDTGSSDNTPAIIRDTLQDIPGTLCQDAWVNFGHNRTLAIQRARGRADYYLLPDADDTLLITAEFRDKLTADQYLVRYSGPLDYQLPLLVSDRHDWRYIGATHEYLHSDTAITKEHLPEVLRIHHVDGANRAEKYRRDLALLLQAVEVEPQNTRNMFYLAQTYRDMGLMARAIQWYVKRAAAGGWEEEVFYSLYQIARAKHLSTLPWSKVMDAYLQAYAARPCRLEPLCQVARHFREQGQYELGYLFSRPVIENPYPKDLLFIERSVYCYEMPMEYAICCYWLGKHEEAIRVNDAIIASPDIPEDIRATARRNRQFSTSKETHMLSMWLEK